MSKLPLTADVGDAQVDLDRPRRCGFPEVIFAEGKTVAAMEKIFEALLATAPTCWPLACRPNRPPNCW